MITACGCLRGLPACLWLCAMPCNRLTHVLRPRGQIAFDVAARLFDAAAVVAEAMVRLTLAQHLLEKFGGDSIEETRRNIEGYLASWPEHMR